MKFVDFFRIAMKVISSISIVGVYQMFFHWFILRNINEIFSYLQGFKKPIILVLGLTQLIIFHYIVSIKLLFRDWFPNWKTEEVKLNNTKE